MEAAIEKEKAKRAFDERDFKAEPGELEKAVRYVLMLKGHEFTIGQPMLFRLEMRNVGDKTIVFYDTDVMAQDPMIVIDSKGEVESLWPDYREILFGALEIEATAVVGDGQSLAISSGP